MLLNQVLLPDIAEVLGAWLFIRLRDVVGDQETSNGITDETDLGHVAEGLPGVRFVARGVDRFQELCGHVVRKAKRLTVLEVWRRPPRIAECKIANNGKKMGAR